MACSCNHLALSIIGGEGIIVSGSGAPRDELVIALESGLVQLQGLDSDTVDLQIRGSGATGDPFLIEANARLSTSDLLDVDPAGAPTLGDTLTFDGTRFVYGAPPSVAPGSVNTGDGVLGDGTLANPLSVAVSNDSETSLTGLETYIDSAGELRAVPPASVAVTWASLTGKPATFPSTWAEVGSKPTTFPSTWSDVAGKPTAFTPSAHTHPSSDITGNINAATIGGRAIYVQSTAPASANNGDIWIQTS